ncbi:MAG: hypothetical protein ACK415_09100 [Thermodesulfovibrionales bacterium]
MSDGKQQEVEQPFIVNTVVAVAIIIGGFYIFSGIPGDDRIKLIDDVFTTVRYKVQVKQLLSQMSSSLARLNPEMQYYVLFFILKTFLFFEIAPLLLLAYLLAVVDTGIEKSDIFDVRVPSVTAFHTARKLVPVCLLFMPLLYIAMPLEFYLNGFRPETILYSTGIANSVLVYRIYCVMRLNKPPVM